MSCDSIMIPDPPSLRADTPLDQAMQVLAEHRAHSLPVVDDDGRFVGMFDLHQLMKLLLPKAVTMELGLRQVSYVTDTVDTWEHLRRQLKKIGDDPVADHLTTDVPVVHPTTATLEALRNLYHRPGQIPVVEKASGRLVGVISCWDVIDRIGEET
ncbi:CBS domain-containing protein [Endothiovibrio diazotrophicus]